MPAPAPALQASPTPVRGLWSHGRHRTGLCVPEPRAAGSNLAGTQAEVWFSPLKVPNCCQGLALQCQVQGKAAGGRVLLSPPAPGGVGTEPEGLTKAAAQLLPSPSEALPLPDACSVPEVAAGELLGARRASGRGRVVPPQPSLQPSTPKPCRLWPGAPSRSSRGACWGCRLRPAAAAGEALPPGVGVWLLLPSTLGFIFL